MGGKLSSWRGRRQARKESQSEEHFERMDGVAAHTNPKVFFEKKKEKKELKKNRTI